MLGTVVFLGLMWALQSLKFFEFVVLQQVSILNIFKLSYYLAQSAITIAIPVAFLFAIIWGISRAKSEGEILALEASGVSALSIYLPILLMSLALTGLCIWLSLFIVPNGQNRLEIMLRQMGVKTVISGFKTGTFTEGFAGMIFYAEEAENDQIKRVFIYDKREPNAHFAITAQSASLKKKKDEDAITLRLADGSIHVIPKGQQEFQQKIDFDIYDVNLDINSGKGIGGWHTVPEFTYPMLIAKRKETEDSVYRIKLELELHRRFAMAFACVVFGALGYFIGLKSKKGMGSSSVVLCLLIAVIYWLGYLWATAASLSGSIPPWIGVWIPNFVFLLIPLYFARKFRLAP